MLKRLKVSLALIILGNLLYLALSFFSDSNSSFQEFTSGLLLGLSIGINLIGILLLLYTIVKYNKDGKQ